MNIIYLFIIFIIILLFLLSFKHNPIDVSIIHPASINIK